MPIDKKRTRYKLKGLVSKVNTAPIFILGNQKSGTTAIVSLLGEYSGLSYSNDLRDEIKHPIFQDVFSGQQTLGQLIRKNRLDFSREIIKEPNLSLIYKELKLHFPEARFVMVMREPRDNIRSILNRLDIPGTKTTLTNTDIGKISPAWQAIIFNKGLRVQASSHIEHMAIRWKMIANTYFENKSDFLLIRYEDFLLDKYKAIKILAEQLKLSETKDISSFLDKPFQKPGTKTTEYRKFFGQKNTKIIDLECRIFAEKFGYIN